MLLPFIDDAKLLLETKKVIDALLIARSQPDSVIFKNVIDPFSALFDASIQNVPLDNWLNQERNRQIQKTFQNAIGQFHQNILGAMPGWESLPTGGLIDVKNNSRKIITEIKNKYNTTHGTDRVSIYDNLASALGKPEYQNYTAYYVEIIPKTKLPYDKPFTPSDNLTHTRRPVNDKIRVISGQAFYDLASKHQDSLKLLFENLPSVIAEITGETPSKITGGINLTEIFNKAY